MRVQHIVKSFGTVMAVNDVSFDVRPGEIFACLGPNGAGKTTIIKMLTTLLRPTTGALELDGLDVTTHRTEVRKRFGVVFQDPSLDSELTAWENMDIHGVLYHVPRHPRRERCEALLRMFELWERRDDLVKTSSDGMKGVTRVPHHPLHGRSGSRGRPHRRDRSRAPRRHRLVRRAQDPDRRRFARSSVPGAHRHDDPGRERHGRGPDAAGRPRVEEMSPWPSSSLSGCGK